MTLLPNNWLSRDIAEIARLAPVEQLSWPSINSFGVTVYCKRDELLHPQLSGNKFYKLYSHIAAIRSSCYNVIASFGGAYSNHLYALAALGHALSIQTVGIIRGEKPAQLSATLRDLQGMGMTLQFVSRQAYRQRQPQEWLAELQLQYGSTYLIDEGGRGVLAARGCYHWGRQALLLSPLPPDVICVAAGTGTTAAGLSAASGDIPVEVYCALKGSNEAYLRFVGEIQGLAEQVKFIEEPTEKCALPSIRLETNYHCGGYAKYPRELREFVAQFEAQTQLLLDPVYTAKMFWGIWHKIQSGQYPQGCRLLVMHSGGLQGRRGMTSPNS